MRLLILGCSATKRHTPERLPAVERYCGPPYRVLHAFARDHPKRAREVMVFILSAEFGLIAGDCRIPDYDRRLDVERAVEMRARIAEQARALLVRDVVATCVNLGNVYHQALVWPELYVALGGAQRFGAVTITSGGIGRRLGQLKRWLEQADE